MVEANLAACAQGSGEGHAINVACGERYTLLDLLQAMCRILEVRTDPEFLPARAGDVRHSQASIEMARRELGFTPRVGFEEGLRRTVESYRGTGPGT